jgi:plastocyanin
VPHNVFFDAVAGAPPNITQPLSNASQTVTFNAVGTFTYTCHIHPFMHGTVTVVAGP